jgi:hypothetical protein
MKDEKILANIQELKSLCGARDAKYRRNFRKYAATPYATLDTLRTQTSIGYFQVDDYSADDTETPPSLNVIKSVIDTLTSKIAQSKVRPFFNVVNGDFKDIQAAKQAQQYFDIYFDQQGVTRLVAESFKDSCIFDTGVIFINPKTKVISKALPNQVYIRPSERTYNKLTRCYYEQKDFPLSLLSEDIRKKIVKEGVEYVDYGLYFDINSHILAHTLNGRLAKKEEYLGEQIPFVFIYYENPVVGNSASSVCDILNTIQNQIDLIMAKISDAMQLTPANTILVPDGSGLKASMMNNRIGNVLTYKMSPNMTSSPVSVATPSFIDNQYLQLLQSLFEKAYELVGVSQLSAQSKKPGGLESGVALSTMEDVESERFETQLNQVIHCYVDIAKACIAVFNQEDDILPAKNTRMPMKWKDIVKASDMFEIQYSAADSLSKDPSVKLKQLQALVQAGVIPPSRLGSFMQIPDLETGYSLANNAMDAVMKTINDCIENDVYEVDSFVPFDMLKEEILNTQLSLKAGNDKKNKKDIDKLTKLYENIESASREMAVNQQELQNDVVGASMMAGEQARNAATPPSIKALEEVAQGGQPRPQQPTEQPQGDISQVENINQEDPSNQNMRTWAGDTSRA